MAYLVKEIFYTLQGEGFHAGRPAVFCRFAGCNLWSGREVDRPTAQCQFCDTDFVGVDGTLGGKYGSAADLAARVISCWTDKAQGEPMVVLTGGEPLLQVDGELLDALHAEGLMVAVETNGTLAAPEGIDWICVSPKAGTEIKQTSGNELKLVYPQAGLEPERFTGLQFEHFFLQPMDSHSLLANTKAAITYCQTHPAWHLSVQIHKILGIR